MKIVNLSKDRFGVYHGGGFFSKSTGRWYTKPRDVLNNCMMSQEDAVALMTILQISLYDETHNNTGLSG